MSADSATARMLRQRTVSPTLSMLASVFDEQGRPGRGSSLFKSFDPLEKLSTRQTLITINIHQQTVRFWSGFPSSARNLTVTRCSTSRLNINPTELRYTAHFKQRLLPHCWPMALEVVGLVEGRGHADMPSRSLLARPQGLGKQISPRISRQVSDSSEPLMRDRCVSAQSSGSSRSSPGTGIPVGLKVDTTPSTRMGKWRYSSTIPKLGTKCR
jgi:hypothetical protein